MTEPVDDDPKGCLMTFGQSNEFQASASDRFSAELTIFRQTENIINGSAIDFWKINLLTQKIHHIEPFCLEGFIDSGIVFDHQPAQADILDGNFFSVGYNNNSQRL